MLRTWVLLISIFWGSTQFGMELDQENFAYRIKTNETKRNIFEKAAPPQKRIEQYHVQQSSCPCVRNTFIALGINIPLAIAFLCIRIIWEKL